MQSMYGLRIKTFEVDSRQRMSGNKVPLKRRWAVLKKKKNPYWPQTDRISPSLLVYFFLSILVEFLLELLKTSVGKTHLRTLILQNKAKVNPKWTNRIAYSILISTLKAEYILFKRILEWNSLWNKASVE